MPEARSNPRSILVGLALLTFATLALRLVGIGFGLPHHIEPDSMLVWHAGWLARPAGAGTGVLCEPDTFYPRLLPWLIAVAPGRSYLEVPPLDAGLAAHLAALAGPFLKARIVIACLSVLAVPATFFLARRFLDARWSLVAAGFYATSLLATNFAQQARPHAAMAGLMALGLVLVLRILDRPSWTNYLLGGLGAGLALAGLHNGAVLVLALGAAHLLARERSWPRFAGALAVVAACFVPFWWAILARGLESVDQGISIGGQDVTADRFGGQGFAQIPGCIWSYEPVACVLAAVLVAAWLLRRVVLGERARPLAVLLACFVPFLFVFGMRNVTESRFYVPCMSALALLAAGGLRALRLSPRVGALALVPGLFVSAKLVWLRSQGESVGTVARWLEEHADREHDTIGVQPSFTLPLFSRRAGLESMLPPFRNPWERYQLALPGEPPGAWDLRCIARSEWWKNRRGPDGEVVFGRAADVAAFAREEHLAYGVASVPTSPGGTGTEILAGLASVGETVFAVHPHDPMRAEISYSAFGLGAHAFLRMLLVERWGQPLEVVRVK